MNLKSKFSDLENEAKLSATKAIADAFKRIEHLDKITQLKKYYKNQELATEAQLKLAIQSQLDGVKDGLEKLDNSYTECCKIRERMGQISHELINIKSLSDGLKSLQDQSRYQKQLAAAMDNMDYLVKVPEMIKQADVLIDSENYLNAHKIIEELEGTRDEIMRELYKQENNDDDLRILDLFFRDVDKLNGKILQHIQFMGERVINAVISQNVVLVNCIRIIDREERTDEIWIQRQAGCEFMPPGRPKRWKEALFSKIKLYVHEKIFESALDEEVETNFLKRHLDAIRCHTIHDLKVIKNIGIICFPPNYRVLDEFVRIYHETISQYVQSKAESILDELEPFQLLRWINQYGGPDFMGNIELSINLPFRSDASNHLLSATQYEKLAQQYLQCHRVKLQLWFNNSVLTDVKDWESEQIPQCDRSLKYITSMSTNVLQPLTEMVGKNQALSLLGDKLREKYFPMFLDEFTNFLKIYSKELKSYKDRYVKNPVPLSLEYLIANCNNCIKIKADLEEIIRKDLDQYPSILVKVENRIQQNGNDILEIAQECLDYIKDMLFADLFKVLSNVMTSEWAFENSNVSDYVLGTVADYNGTLIYLKDAAYRRLIVGVVERIVVEYVKNLLTKRLTLNQDTRKQVGNKIYNEGDKLMEYFSSNMKLDKKVIYCMQALPLISKLLMNSDTAMIRLDINALVKCFPGIRKDQVVTLIMMRGDINMNQAREIASDYVYCSLNDETNLFKKIANAMNQS